MADLDSIDSSSSSGDSHWSDFDDAEPSADSAGFLEFEEEAPSLGAFDAEPFASPAVPIPRGEEDGGDETAPPSPLPQSHALRDDATAFGVLGDLTELGGGVAGILAPLAPGLGPIAKGLDQRSHLFNAADALTGEHPAGALASYGLGELAEGVSQARGVAELAKALPATIGGALASAAGGFAIGQLAGGAASQVGAGFVETPAEVFGDRASLNDMTRASVRHHRQEFERVWSEGNPLEVALGLGKLTYHTIGSDLKALWLWSADRWRGRAD